MNQSTTIRAIAATLKIDFPGHERHPLTTTLNLRGMDPADIERIRRAASARQMTHGEYVGRLSRLHDVARALVDNGQGFQLGAELTALGLDTVTA